MTRPVTASRRGNWTSGRSPDAVPDLVDIPIEDLVAMSSEDRLAYFDAREKRSNEEAAARRGGPLCPESISATKGDFPVITHVVRPAPGQRDR